MQEGVAHDRVAAARGFGAEALPVWGEALEDVPEALMWASVSALVSNCAEIAGLRPSWVRKTAVKAPSSIQRMNSSDERAITGTVLPPRSRAKAL
jgi:hypothetical protein